MAKQCGDIKLTGSIDDLCFYRMCGEYYVRMKSSLMGKRFWKDAAFEGSRESCQRFAEGNRLASKLYRMVEEEKRMYSLFCFLKKRAIQLLKDGKSLLKVEEVLIDYLTEFGFLECTQQKDIVKQDCFRVQSKSVLHPVLYDDRWMHFESG